jgi:hypothetical protein
MGVKPADSAHTIGLLARTVVESILGAHPHIAEFTEEMKEHFRAKFLDGLEVHTAKLVNPLLTSVSDVTAIPPELVGILEELGLPTEQFTGIISQFFIFGVMFNVAGAMLAPFVQQIQNDVWIAHPDRPLSPPDIATAVVRGFTLGDSGGTTVPGWATSLAAESGYDADTFATQVGITGMAPNLQLLFEMIRRGVIDEGTLGDGAETLVGGIQQSDIRDVWIPLVTQLRYAPPSPNDLVAAAVRHQDDTLPAGTDLSYWETLAENLGLEPPNWLKGNPNWFNMLYNISGRPLGPEEMVRLANRGQLPWTGTGSTVLSVQQGVAESDIKDKWFSAVELLGQYWPAVGETGALLQHGGITEAQAEAYWTAEGVPAELLAALKYVNTVQQVTQEKLLTKGDIETLLQLQAITDQDALLMLAELGYTGDNAAAIVELAHFRFELRAIEESVRTVSTLYTSRAITATQATAALQDIGMPAAQITQLVDTLTNARNSEVKIPTVTQMASALYYGVVDYEDALAFLVEQGYSEDDAWLVLSVRMHGPISPAPSGVTIPTPAPVATTTTATS